MEASQAVGFRGDGVGCKDVDDSGFRDAEVMEGDRGGDGSIGVEVMG